MTATNDTEGQSAPHNTERELDCPAVPGSILFIGGGSDGKRMAIHPYGGTHHQVYTPQRGFETYEKMLLSGGDDHRIEVMVKAGMTGFEVMDRLVDFYQSNTKD